MSGLREAWGPGVVGAGVGGGITGGHWMWSNIPASVKVGWVRMSADDARSLKPPPFLAGEVKLVEEERGMFLAGILSLRRRRKSAEGISEGGGYGRGRAGWRGGWGGWGYKEGLKQ